MLKVSRQRKAQSHVDDHFQNCFVPLDELLKERKKLKENIELANWAHKIIE